MIIAIVFALLLAFAGYATLRALKIAKGPSAFAALPAVGAAVLSVVADWTRMAPSSVPLPGVLVAALGLTGLGLCLVDREPLWVALRSVWREHRLATMLLAVALIVPCVVMGVAFAGEQAPLSPHDGAFHVEMSDAFRRGMPVASWYPPGMAALFGASLQLVPWLDTARGVFELGVALTLIAPLAVFGVGTIAVRNMTAAAAAALLTSLTHLFPYYPQLWGGWPQLCGILLVLGLWIIAAQYLERPTFAHAVVVGFLVGAIGIVHGTELYSAAIVLAAIAVINHRRMQWTRLAMHVPVAIMVAVICAAPYLPLLFHWVGSGGAFAVGYEDAGALQSSGTSSAELLAVLIADALGVDLPIRILVVAIGLVAAVRTRAAGAVVAVGSVFIVLSLAATFMNGVPVVRQIYAATYPWSLPFRHLTFASITLALIGGFGVEALRRTTSEALRRLRGTVARRRLNRMSRLLVVTWLGLSVWALVVYLSIAATRDSSFGSDDAAAMAWLRDSVEPDALVINDTFADAGIWAPYKAGVKILVYRSFSDPATATERTLVLDSVPDLNVEPGASAVCALNARYLYRGAANAAWQMRAFPPLEALRASTALEQVFSRGGAAVFRVRVDC